MISLAVISPVLPQARYPVVIATSQTFQYSGFYSYLPQAVYVPCSTGSAKM